MKRKRGHKKGKPKGPVGANESFPGVISQSAEENSGMDEHDYDEYDSVMEVDTPSSTGTHQPGNLANINSVGSVDEKVGKSVGRVKVKLKTSRILDSQHTSSDAPTQSDTDKSSHQVDLEKNGLTTEKMEDSANSLPEMKAAVLANPSKKAGSIKIKSSKCFSPNVNQTSNVISSQVYSRHKMESQKNFRDSQYDKQELDSALEVIKKVMKMDAAEPFNTPVNPEALGIPDYFDVIDTPMDFGTIRQNLENGVKYMNSKDVFEDVQYIWENCHKYNNKGDYIMDLMRRVKKNFTKYWTAAGLYTESRGIGGSESFRTEDNSQSGQGKLQGKGGSSKQKARKRHGRRHKNDCLCAICVLKRRRREREENARIGKAQIGASESSLAQDLKQEESSPVGSPCGENSSSNMDESLDPDADDAEVKGEDMEVTEQKYSPLEEKHKERAVENEMESQEKSDSEILNDQTTGEANGRSMLRISDKSANETHINNPRYIISAQNVEDTGSAQRQKEKDLQRRLQKSKVYESLSYQNPMLLDLCGVLFPDNQKSAWGGPHSLVGRSGSARASSIHAAVETLMK